MYNNKDMGKVLYELLPNIYKKVDSDRTHLKRYLQIPGVGMDFLGNKIEGYSNLFDIDNTPAELLPQISRMMGFEYPYDMTIKEQRSMLKILPTLYNLKGTKSVFNYLAQQIFGTDAKANVEWVSRGGENGENLILIEVEARGETTNLQSRIDRYYKYAEIFRPINHKIYWSVTYHYTDRYNTKNKVIDSNFHDLVKTMLDETYSKEIQDNYSTVLTYIDSDEFLISSVTDDHNDVITIVDSAEYLNKITDYHKDIGYDKSAAMNIGRFNDTAEFNRKEIIFEREDD